MALVVPILFILVLAIVDFGLGLRAWISITNAAREGARVAAVRGSCEAVREHVKDASGSLVTSDDQITITPSTCAWSAGSSAKVTVEYEYDFVTPLGGLLSILGGAGLPATITMSATSDMRVE